MNLHGALKMDIYHIGFGMLSVQNDEIILAGGFRSGNSGPGESRVKFMVYDATKIHSLVNEGVEHNDAQKKSEAGFVELYLKDSGRAFDVAGLVNIEIYKEIRGEGLGRKVVQSILDTTDSYLDVIDIQPNALVFWNKMGVSKWGLRRDDACLSYEEVYGKRNRSALYGRIREGHQIKSAI